MDRAAAFVEKRFWSCAGDSGNARTDMGNAGEPIAQYQAQSSVWSQCLERPLVVAITLNGFTWNVPYEDHSIGSAIDRKSRTTKAVTRNFEHDRAPCAFADQAILRIAKVHVRSRLGQNPVARNAFERFAIGSVV